MLLTMRDIASLAKLGRKKVLDDMKKNVISYLGQLPTDVQIDAAFAAADVDLNWSWDIPDEEWRTQLAAELRQIEASYITEGITPEKQMRAQQIINSLKALAQ